MTVLISIYHNYIIIKRLKNTALPFQQHCMFGLLLLLVFTQSQSAEQAEDHLE